MTTFLFLYQIKTFTRVIKKWSNLIAWQQFFSSHTLYSLCNTGFICVPMTQLYFSVFVPNKNIYKSYKSGQISLLPRRRFSLVTHFILYVIQALYVYP